MAYGLSNRSGSVFATGGRAKQLTSIVDQSSNRTDRNIPVLVDRLDDIALTPPDLIKIDVEDHERELFEGGLRTLLDHHPLILFECRKGSDGGEAGMLLRSNGYSLYQLNRSGSNDTVLELHPIDSKGQIAKSGSSNVVAVRQGDEMRWFN